MSINGFLPHTVSILHRSASTEDAYGNTATVTASTTTSPARMWQLESAEVTVGRNTATDQWRVILPAAAVIDASDRIEWDGKSFDVDGSPEKVYGARTVHHVEAPLRYAGPVT